MLKALQAQEKQATRLRQRDAAGPKDDLDLEWEALIAQQQADGCVSMPLTFHRISYQVVSKNLHFLHEKLTF